MAVTISGVSGATHGSPITITGTGFGAHADYGGAENFLCRGWNDFTVALADGNWEDDPGSFNPVAGNLDLSTSSPLGGACTQFFRKRNINRSSDEQLGCVTITTSGAQTIFYTSFWHRQSAGLGDSGGDGTKFFRHYYANDPKNYYLAPDFENSTDIVTPPASINRFADTTAFGGTATFRSLIADTWVFMEMVAIKTGGTTAYGSDDYVDWYTTIPGTGRQRMFRRGTGLASNPVPAEGTDANENQGWVDNASSADGHTCGDLGSLCAASELVGAHMDYADAYQSHTIARVMVGNASTFSACDIFHMQIPTAWSTTSITATGNRGQFSSLTGQYVYVVSELNEVNASGFQIGSAGGGVTRSSRLHRRLRKRA